MGIYIDGTVNGKPQKKYIVGAQEMDERSITLAAQITEDGFFPDIMMALWRGGCFPGCYAHEAFKQAGLKTDHIAPRISGYEGVAQRKSKENGTAVYGVGYVVRHGEPHLRGLVIDDVWETDLTGEAIVDTLSTKMRFNMPLELKIATVFWKGEGKPDYWNKKIDSDAWIILPYEFEGLTDEEIVKYRGQKVYTSLQRVRKATNGFDHERSLETRKKRYAQVMDQITSRLRQEFKTL